MLSAARLSSIPDMDGGCLGWKMFGLRNGEGLNLMDLAGVEVLRVESFGVQVGGKR